MTPSDKALVAELTDTTNGSVLAARAASRIEALSADLERVTGERDSKGMLGMTRAEARALAAEAEVKRLRSTLRTIADAHYAACPFSKENCAVQPDEPCPVCGDINDMEAASHCPQGGASAIARQALAPSPPKDKTDD